MADKMKGGIIGGSTDVSIPVILRKTADNKELTGVLDASIACSYWRQGGTRTAISMTSLAAADSAHTDGGWVEVASATMPGVYRLDPPDAAIASGADWVVFSALPNGGTSGYLWVQEYTITGDPASSIGFAVINVATASLIAAIATLSTTINATAASLALTADVNYMRTSTALALAASLALTAYDPPTKAEMDALAASLALTAYDPPTMAEMNALAASLALTAYDAPTKGEMDSGFAALNDVAAADIWAFIIDGTLDAQDAVKWVLAYSTGNIAVVGNAYSYRAVDQSTTLFTLTASTTMRTIS